MTASRDNMATRKDEDQEMSMEEILASIRKYVTEDGTTPDLPSNSQLLDEDVLDLKHVGASIIDHPPHATQQTEPPAAKVEAPRPPVQEETHTPHPIPVAPAPEMSKSPTPQHQPPADSSHFTSGRTMTASAQSLSRLVETARSAKYPEAEAPKPQAQPASEFAPGVHVTLENLAIQAMTPMIKAWIDANLSSLVERLVEKEIRRITEELMKK